MRASRPLFANAARIAGAIESDARKIVAETASERSSFFLAAGVIAPRTPILRADFAGGTRTRAELTARRMAMTSVVDCT